MKEALDYEPLIQSVAFREEEADDDEVLVEVHLDEKNPQLNDFINKQMASAQRAMISGPHQKLVLTQHRDPSKFTYTRGVKAELEALLKEEESFSRETSYRFYQIYGKKMVHYEFANWELFNHLFDNSLYPAFGISGALTPESGYDIARYGRCWSSQAIGLADQNLGCLLEGLNFYLIFCRERLYSVRGSLIFRISDLRHSYPYKYCYIGNLEDTISFSLQYLNSDKINQQISKAPQDLLSYCSELSAKQSHMCGDSESIGSLSQHILLPFQFFHVDAMGSIQKVDIILLHVITNEEEGSSVQEVKLIFFQNNPHTTKQYITSCIKWFIEQFLEVEHKQISTETIPSVGMINDIKSLVTYIDTQIFYRKEPIKMEEVADYLKQTTSTSILPMEVLFPSKTSYNEMFNRIYKLEVSDEEQEEEEEDER